MTITAAVLTNGRSECLRRSLPTLEEQVAPFDRRIIFDDSGSDEYAAWLVERFPSWDVRPRRGAHRGYAGAMRRALDELVLVEPDWIFISEDDFLYHRPVDLVRIAAAMDRRPRIVQAVLLRQPWFQSEIRAGGVLERFPAADRVLVEDGDDHWIEHRLFWSMNPHLVRAELLREHRWPLGADSEARFGREIFRSDPRRVAAVWGDGSQWVEHIGATRVGSGY